MGMNLDFNGVHKLKSTLGWDDKYGNHVLWVRYIKIFHYCGTLPGSG